MVGDLRLVQCLLCRGSLPAVKDDIFMGHMQEQHRAYFNLDFLFTSFFLTDESINQTLEFMVNIDSVKDTLASDDQKFEMNENVVDVETNLEEEVENVEIRENDDEESISLKVEDNGKIEENEQVSQAAEKHFSKIEKENTVSKASDEGTKVVQKKSRTKKQKPLRGTLKKDSIKNEEFKSSKISKKRKAKKEKKNKSNVCSECGKVFDNIYYMSTHMRYTHDYNIHICDLCDRKCQGAAMLKLHKRRFHKAKETCEECGLSVKKLREHIATKHTKNEDKNFRCNECGKGFIIKSRLAEHSHIHLDKDKKPFPCRWEGCSMTFASNGNRMKHQQKHIKAEKVDPSDISVTKTEDKTNKVQAETNINDDNIGTTTGNNETVKDITLNHIPYNDLLSM